MFPKLKYLALTVSSSAWASEPIVLPLGKIGEKEVNAILPSDKWMIILMICGQIIWALYTEIKKQKEKRENKDSEKLDRLYEIVHKIEGRLMEVGQAPTETEILMGLQPHIKVAVMEALMKYKGNGKL